MTHAAKKQFHPSGVRLTKAHECWVYAGFAALLLTGALWLVFHRWITVPSEFGEQRHPLEAWWLRLHGGAALLFLVVLGTLLPIHVRGAWRLRRNRRSGASVLAVMGLLTVTGYGLYYLGGETARSWTSIIHWGVGLLTLPILAGHVWWGKKFAAKRQ